MHAQKAFESVEARLAELQAGLDGTLPPEPEHEPAEVDKTGKGKGKSTGMKLKRDDLVQKMSKSQIIAEKKELEELKGDLAAKVSFIFPTVNFARQGLINDGSKLGRRAQNFTKRDPHNVRT